MSARTAIAAVLVNSANYPAPIRVHILGRDLTGLIDKVTEAVEGARTITTYEELRALPDGTVIRVIGDDDWEVYLRGTVVRGYESCWHGVGDDITTPDSVITLPAVVLYSPVVPA